MDQLRWEQGSRRRMRFRSVSRGRVSMPSRWIRPATVMADLALSEIIAPTPSLLVMSQNGVTSNAIWKH